MRLPLDWQSDTSALSRSDPHEWPRVDQALSDGAGNPFAGLLLYAVNDVHPPISGSSEG